MANRQYQCSRLTCNAKFEANEYTVVECPVCHSREFKPVGGASFLDKIKSFVKTKPAKIGGAIFLLILLILFFRGGGDKASADVTYEISFANESEISKNPTINYVDLEITEVTKSDDGRKARRNFTQDDYRMVIPALNFRTINNGIYGPMPPFDASIPNRFYPCSALFTIDWETNIYKVYNGSKDHTMLIAFNGTIDKPKCACNDLPMVISADAVGGCKLRVTTNLDENNCGKKVSISINGPKGVFKSPPFEWTLTESPYKLDIWMEVDGQTYDFAKNGGMMTLPGCVPPPTAASIAAIKSNLISLGNNYAANPNDRSLRVAFNNHLRTYSTSIKITIAGEVVEATGMFTIIKSNPERHFKIDPSSVVVDGSGMILKFSWIEQ